MQVYRTEKNIFPDELLGQFNQELLKQKYIPYSDGLRRDIHIFKETLYQFTAVTFSNGALINWTELKDKLVANETICKAIEVALEYFGRERNLDGEEKFTLGILGYKIKANEEVARGAWHSDSSTNWTMITLLSDASLWEGGDLLFHPKENPEECKDNKWINQVQKTAYVKNRAIFFQNIKDGIKNYHAFEGMKSAEGADRVILTIFQKEKSSKI